jgi:hypothetical protein
MTILLNQMRPNPSALIEVSVILGAHGLINHPGLSVRLLLHREDFPGILFYSSVTRPQLPCLLCQFLRSQLSFSSSSCFAAPSSIQLYPYAYAATCHTIRPDRIATIVALPHSSVRWGVIELGTWEVRGIVFAKENLEAGQLLAVAIRDFDFDFDMAIKNIFAGTI